MKKLTKAEMIELCRKHPNGGIAFCEGRIDCDGYFDNNLMVTDGGLMFATNLLPDWRGGDVYRWDWSLEADYFEDEYFFVFEEKEIRQMIKILERALKEYE